MCNFVFVPWSMCVCVCSLVHIRVHEFMYANLTTTNGNEIMNIYEFEREKNLIREATACARSSIYHIDNNTVVVSIYTVYIIYLIRCIIKYDYFFLYSIIQSF